MTEGIADISPRQAAVVAGASILIMAVAAVFATDFTLGRLVVPGNMEATTTNIQESGMLFRAGVFSWIVILICDVLAAWGLYLFLEPTSRNLSLLMAWLRLVYAAILGAALGSLVNTLLLARGDDSITAIGMEQLQTQVMLSLNGFNETWSMGLVVFGFHILVLGYLVLRSGYIPTVFGVLLVVAFFGYLLTSADDLFLAGYENYKMVVEWIFITPMVAGEVGLGLWLLFKGGKGLASSP